MADTVVADVSGGSLAVGANFLGRYQVVRCIKAGGMGAVYEVIHLETKRRRALKVMLPSVLADPDLRARFRLEATVTAEIETEHIVETFDAGVDPETGAPFLVMELLKGEDLQTYVERRGRLPAGEVVVLMHQVALALDKTHAAGIVHRDLKPENLFLTRRDDASPRVKVLDFGIAKIVAQSSQAQATRNIGTPLYMSPEQLQGDGRIGPRADIYALGHIAFTLLVGAAYWEAESRSTDGIYPFLVKLMAGAKEPASVRASRRGVTLEASFDRWFAKATAASPQDRYEKPSVLLQALADALGVTAPGPSAAPLDEAPDPSTQRKAQAVSAGALESGTSEPFPATRLSASDEPVARGARGASGTFAAMSERVTPTRKRSIMPFAALAIALAAGLIVAVLVRGGRPDAADPISPTSAAPLNAAAASAAPAPILPPESSAISISSLPDVTPADPALVETSAPSAVAPPKAPRQPVATSTPVAARPPPPPVTTVRKPPRDFGDRK